MLNKIKRSDNPPHTINALILLGIFGVFLLFSCLTPYIYDDIAGHYRRVPEISFFDVVPGETPEISSFQDILDATIMQFRFWGGRVIATFVTYTVFFWGKAYFNLFNALFAAGVIWMICRHICGREVVRPSLLAWVSALFFLCAPTPGLTFFWASGAITYLWSAFFYLLLLYPFRLFLTDETPELSFKLRHLLLLPLGVIACNANENIAASILLVMGIVMVDSFLRFRKVPLWMCLSAAGAAVGFLLIMTSPGTSNRIAYEGYQGIPVVTNFFRQTAHLFHTIPALFAVILGLLYFRFRKIDMASRRLAIFYLLLILASGYCMIFSPYTPGRAVFGTFIFMLCCAGYLWRKSEFPAECNKLLLVITLVLAVMNAAFALRDIRFTNRIIRERFAVMEKAQRNHESKDWVFRPMCGMSRYNALYKTDLLRDEAAHFLNRYFALKYGQKSILLAPAPAIQGMAERIYPHAEND